LRVLITRKLLLFRVFFFLLLLLSLSTVFAALPTVSNGIQSEQLPGKSVCFDVAFNNMGSPGYEPYIRLILPPELSFNSSSSPVLGPVNAIDAGIFAPPSNELVDSLSLNIPDTISGPQDSHLYLLEIPVGSVVAGGPALLVNVCTTLATSAVIGVPLNISTQGVYRFGDTPTASEGDTIEGSTDTQQLTPVLAILQKNSTAAENERVPGAAFPFTYMLNVELAQTKLVNDLFLTDTPDFAALAITTPATISGSNCAVDDDINNGTALSVHCDPITGTAGSSDVTAQFGSYVTNVLNPDSCAVQAIINQAGVSGNYLGNILSDTKNHTLNAKHAAIQSTSSASTVNPGDIVTFTSNFQFNAYNATLNVIIEERLSDGLSLVPGSASLRLGSAPAAAIVPAAVGNPDDSTSLFFDISGNHINTDATLSYQVQVDTLYSGTGLPLLAGDPLARTSTLNYDVDGGAAVNCSDGSSSQLSVVKINTEKSIIAPQAQYFPGDNIEFLLEIDIPSGYVSDIIVQDFLPLPVLDASALDTNTDINANANFSFDPADTHNADPDSLIVSAATNSFTLKWNSIQPALPGPSPIHALRLNIPIKNIPFSDGLTLNNLVTYQVRSTDGSLIQQEKSASFVVRAPLLEITKGIAATNNPAGVFTPPLSTPVDSDLSEVEAGNQLDYVITIENIGGHAAANVFISDISPAGLINCTVDSIEDGLGAVLAVSPAADNLFTTGITIDHHVVDLVGTMASLAANDGSIGTPYGEDTAIIRYHCELADTVYPQQEIDNTATTRWTNVGSAILYPDQIDTARVTISTVAISKDVAQIIPLSDSSGDPATVTVGDIIEYEFPVVLPEGSTENLTLVDTLPDGYIYQPGSLSHTLDPAGIILANAPAASVSGNDLTISIAGTTEVVSDADPGNNTITFKVRVLVADVGQNDGSSHQQLKHNIVRLNYTNKPAGDISASYDNHFVEPVAGIAKHITPSSLEGGDSARVKLIVTNTGTSPLYDVQVTDILNQFGNVVDLAQPVVPVVTPANYNFSFASPIVSYTMSSGSLLPGQSDVFEFDVTILAGAVTGTKFKNEADVQGSSQPASAGTAVSRGTSDTDNDFFQISTLGLSKRLVASSESFTDDKDKEAAIGEILTYRLTFSIPKNTLTLSSTTKPFISDLLPEGYRYVDGSAIAYANHSDIFYSQDPLNTVPDPGWPEIPTTPTNVDPSSFFSVANDNRELSFAFGNINNVSADPDKDLIIIEYQVQVLNHDSNNRGNSKTNRVQVNYLNGFNHEQHLSRSLSTIIAEPELDISKVASPKSIVAGQLIDYVLSFTNNSSLHSTYAWDAALSDIMNKNKFSLPTLLSATMSRGGQDLSACVVIDSTALVHRVRLDMSACLPANERFLAPGETVIIHYTSQAAADALFEDELKNSAVVTATSLPGNTGSGGSGILGAPGTGNGERTGDLSLPVNDINAYTQESVFVNKPIITKTSDAHLQIGDSHSQTLTISIPPGSTSNFVVADNLPAGLFFPAQIVSLTIPPGLTYSGTPQVNWPAASNHLNFDFGDILNSLTSAVEVVISYQVRVDNILSNQQGTQLLNQAQLSYNGAVNPSSDNARVSVIEPAISLQKKIIAGAAGSVAGDLVTYQVQLKNTSTEAIAYRLNLVDVIAEDLTANLPDSFALLFVDNPGGKVINSSNGLPLVKTDAIIQTTIVPDDTLTWPALTLLPEGSLTIEYQLKVVATAVAGDTLNNTVTADYNSQASGVNGRDGSDGAAGLNNYVIQKSATLTLAAGIALTKQLDIAHPSDKFTIGDEVFYDVIVNMQEGTTNNVQVTDLLPIGVTMDALLGIHAPKNISYNGSGNALVVPAIPDPATETLVTIDLGRVENIADGDATNDFLVIRLKGIVEDIAANVQGVILTNEANVTADGGIADGPATINIEIIEPNLEIIKTPSNPTPPIGGVFSYSVEVLHNNSFSDARNVLLTDVIPAGLHYVPGSTSGQAVVDETDPGSPVFTLGDITLSEASKRFSFDVTVDSSVPANIAITNTISALYNGQTASHAPLPVRQYTGSGAVDVTPIDADFIYATKTVALTGDVDGNGINNPGDTMTYTIILLNKHSASLSDVVFKDSISSLVDYVPGSLSTTQGIDSSPSLTELEVQVGRMAGGAVVTITYQVVIKTTVLDGTIVFNQGNVNTIETAVKLTDWDGNEVNGYQPTQFPVAIVSPPSAEIYVQKLVTQLLDADASGSNTPNDTMRYQLIITNDGVLNLSNINVTDLIPDGLSYVPGSITSSAAVSASVSGRNVHISIAGLAVGTQEKIYFDITINDPLYDAGTDGNADREIFINQASVTANGISPTHSDGDGNKANGNQSTHFIAVSAGGFAPPAHLLSPTMNKQGKRFGRWPDINWTVEIVNNLNSRVLALLISDVMPVGASYIAGSLNCSMPPGSTSVINSCVFDAANNSIEIDAILASDLGVMDFALAQHKVIVEFSTSRVGLPLPHSIINTARAYWDANSDGSAIDDKGNGQSPILANARVSEPGAKEIPVLSTFALLILSLLLMLSTAVYLDKNTIK